MGFLKSLSYAAAVAAAIAALAGCGGVSQSPLAPEPIQQSARQSGTANDQYNLPGRVRRSTATMDSILHSFSGNTIDRPTASLIADASGNLYGTAGQGGEACSCGGVFKLSPGPSGYTETTLYEFSAGVAGGGPYAGLYMDSKGNLYGTAVYDGSGNGTCCGTVFELTPYGSVYSEKTLYDFQGGTDGAYPVGGLIADSTGVLYGTTQAGGDANGDGTVFKLTPSRSGYVETVLYRFQNCNSSACDGANPSASLYMGAKRDLYGTTLYGGSNECPFNNRCGTVFTLTRSGKQYTEKIIYNFKGGSDGAWPSSTLIADSKGALYGTTGAGGGVSAPQCNSGSVVLGCGTVFELKPKTGQETVLYAFRGGSDAEEPQAGVISDSSGALYGTGETGGSTESGAVFALTPSKKQYTESVLYSFTGPPDGALPRAGLLDVNGTLYGTTWGGGNYSSGAVFSLTP